MIFMLLNTNLTTVSINYNNKFADIKNSSATNLGTVTGDCCVSVFLYFAHRENDRSKKPLYTL